MQFDPKVPIWHQLVEEFSRRISTGQWPGGTKVPSVRELAVELGVNPNTVQKSLAELDRLGLTYSERTSGRFVTDDRQLIAASTQGQAAETTTEYVTKMRGLGASLEDTLALVTKLWKEQP